MLGTDGTISHTQQGIRYTPQKVNRPDGAEMVGLTRNQPRAHMQNVESWAHLSVPLRLALGQ